MLDLVIHWYAYVEVYTIFLVWVVTPLAFFALFLWINRRVGLVATTSVNRVEPHDAKN
jgi:hypothetical protein